MKALVSLLALGSLALSTGCGFFPDTKTSSSTPSPSTSSADYVYVVNQETDTLSGFVVGTGTLTSAGTVALTAGLAPSSVAVTRPNTFVYVGGSGAISCYAVGSTGALTVVSGGGATALANFVSLDTSPDGQWLLALDSFTQTIYVYGINASTGALTLNATPAYAVPGAGIVAQRTIRVSPNGNFVAIALGTGGDVVFPFTTGTGVLGANYNSLIVSTAYSDNALTFDGTGAYLLTARATTGSGTSGIATYSVNSTGGLTAVGTLTASGNAPYSLVLDSTGTYAYVANRADATISGYSLIAGNLTLLASSPYASGSAVTALARDNSGKYILAAASGGSSDLTLYSLDAASPGKLDKVATAASGTDPANSIALATTH